MAKLTKTEIDKAQPGDARYTLWDDEVRGFGVRVFPTTVAIGRDGRVRFTVTGECDWTGAQARGWITPLL